MIARAEVVGAIAEALLKRDHLSPRSAKLPDYLTVAEAVLETAERIGVDELERQVAELPADAIAALRELEASR